MVDYNFNVFRFPKTQNQGDCMDPASLVQPI